MIHKFSVARHRTTRERIDHEEAGRDTKLGGTQLPGGKRRSGSRGVGRKYFAKGGRGTRGSRASVGNAVVSSVQLVQGRPIDLGTAAE
jgi:hypothetical protein